ncbi:MAG: hypothetical protein Q9208_008190 [Pyrenodesmia sp. 3 TL-2023]
MPKDRFLERAWMQSYNETEDVLLALLEYYGYKPDLFSDPTGDASAYSVTRAFDDVENPLHSVLGEQYIKTTGGSEISVRQGREAIDVVRQCRTWYRSHCLAKSGTLQVVNPPFAYKTYYSIVFGALVECLGICVRDASAIESLASCKAKHGSGEQELPGTEQAFACEVGGCQREFNTRKKLNKHVRNQHKSSLQATTAESRSMEEPLDARFAIEEITHAMLLGIPIQASTDAKSTANSLRISDRLRSRMQEVPTSRTGASQQLQGLSFRNQTRSYHTPPATLRSTSRDTSNVEAMPSRNNLEANMVTSFGGFGKAESTDYTIKKEKQQSGSPTSDDTAQISQSNQAHPKPDSSLNNGLEPTILSPSGEVVSVQSELLLGAAGNSIPPQEAPSDAASIYKQLFENCQRIIAGLIQERDELKAKLVHASEEQAAAVQKAKADSVEKLRKSFNAVADDFKHSD